MALLEVSMLKVYDGRMIVIFYPLRLGRSFICQTQDLEKIASCTQHLYNVSQTEVVQYNGPTYQEDDCCEEGHMQKISF
jgi:hypothetical protein